MSDMKTGQGMEAEITNGLPTKPAESLPSRAYLVHPTEPGKVVAAPDLLEAAQAFIRGRATCPTTNGKDLEAWEMLRAAIAKATGGDK